MENCLVTKLRGVVNNDNLNVLGSINLKLDHSIGNTAEMSLSNSESAIVVNLIGDGYFSDSAYTANLGKVTTAANNNKFYAVVNDDCKVYVIDDYKTKNIIARGNSVIYADEIKYRNIKSLTAEHIIGTIDEQGCLSECGYVAINGSADLKAFDGNTVATYFSIKGDNANAKGDISYLAGMVNVSGINLQGNKDVVGNISTLSGLVSTNGIMLGGTSVVGTVESFAEGMLINRESGYVDLNVGETAITFNGNTISGGIQSTYRIQFSQNNVGVYRSNNLLGSYDGTSWAYNA